MTNNNAVDLDINNNADGYDISGGTTKRKLTVTGADVTITGSGTATVTFPSSTTTLVGTDTTDTLTNKSGNISMWTNDSSYLTTVALNDLSDVTITSVATGDFIRYNGTAYINTTIVAGDIPSLDASKITTGTFADARISSATTWNAKLGAVSDDTQPTLGGNLDLNGYGTIVTLTADATGVSAGDLCYINSSGTVTTVNATDNTASSNQMCIALAAVSASSTGSFLLSGIATLSGLTAGSTYYASTTAGGLTTTAPSATGNMVVPVGVAISTTELVFNGNVTLITHA